MESACSSEMLAYKTPGFVSQTTADFSLGYVWTVQVFGYLLMDYTAVMLPAELHCV